MKLVLLPEVAVAAARRNEALHAVARKRLERGLRGQDQLVLPALFFVEVTSALARAGLALDRIGPLLDGLTQPPHRVLTLGPRRAAYAASIAAALSLEPNLAVYVAIAARRKLPLCTLDTTLEGRVAGACKVMQA